MKLNPLHSIDWIVGMMRFSGEYVDPARATGRTTSLALRLLAQAIATPHVWVDIRDHHPTHAASQNLRRLMQEIADRLNLKHLVFRDTGVIFTNEKNP